MSQFVEQSHRSNDLERPVDPTRVGVATLRGSRAKHYQFIDGLRGVLAVYVLFHHFLGWNLASDLPTGLKLLGKPFCFGHSAVCIFIVLSGFSLHLPVVKCEMGRLRGGFGSYLLRRSRRILPAYYAALLLSMTAVWIGSWISPAISNDLTFASVFSHLFLIHTWVPGQTGTINVALWSVATEWHIYFLFPLVLLPAWRKSGSIGLILVAIVIGLTPQFVLPSQSMVGGCPWFVILFAIGMVTAKIFVHRNEANRVVDISVLVGTVTAFLIVRHFAPGMDSGVGWSDVQWLKDGLVGVAAGCMLLLGLEFAQETDSAKKGLFASPVRLLETRVCRRLGMLSYSLYATHCAILTLIAALASLYSLSAIGSFTIRAFIGIPIAILLAHLVSLWFELPFLSPKPKEKVASQSIVESTGVELCSTTSA